MSIFKSEGKLAAYILDKQIKTASELGKLVALSEVGLIKEADIPKLIQGAALQTKKIRESVALKTFLEGIKKMYRGTFKEGPSTQLGSNLLWEGAKQSAPGAAVAGGVGLGGKLMYDSLKRPSVEQTPINFENQAPLALQV